MNIRRYISILSILIMSASGCVCQTVVWQMQPSDYTTVTPFTGNLLRVEKNGKTGLIKTDGSMVTTEMGDDLSLFYDGKALLTINEAKGKRVLGCVTAEGTYHAFSKRYYTLKEQEFYSDDVLSVADENGRLGYVDKYGNTVTGFDGRFDVIKPFVDGHAAVFKNKKYHLIDKSGVTKLFTFSGIAELYGGVNAYNNKVYVWDTEGRFYVHDLVNGGPCKKVKTPNNPTTVDYLYRFSSVTGQTKEVPYNKPTASLPTDMELKTVNGRIGILRHISGESFSSSIKAGSERQNFYSGDKVKCAFSLNVPSVWQGKNLSITFTDRNGQEVSTDVQDYNFSFSVLPEKTESRTYTIKVVGEGLELYEGNLTFNFEHKERLCRKCGKNTISKQAKDGLCANCRTTPSDSACKKCGKKAQLKDGLCADCSKPKQNEPVCKTCGKKISECKYQGVH